MTADRTAQSLLAHCARPRLSPDSLAELVQRAARIEQWDHVPAAAERHGLAPLLYVHLKAAGVALPEGPHTQLAGLYVRHRKSNATRMRVLGEVLHALEREGIPVRVLKGAALIPLVYDDPALRPLADLDLLLPRDRVVRGQQLLQDIGFGVASGESELDPDHHHHLRMTTKQVDGVMVQVELHHDALSRDYRDSLALDDTREPPTAIDLAGTAACALGPHEMLWHLCQHLVGPLPRALRLIWLADVAGFAERFADRLDWEHLARRYPLGLNVLGLAHTLSPLDPSVAARIPPRVVRGLTAVGADALAWAWAPTSPTAPRNMDQVRRMLDPPDWWLTLRFGRDGRRRRWRGRASHLATLWRATGRRASSGFRGGPR